MALIPNINMKSTDKPLREGVIAIILNCRPIHTYYQKHQMTEFRLEVLPIDKSIGT